jgi:hypothetical protein
MLVVIHTDVLVSTAGHPDKRFALWEALPAGRIMAVNCDAAIAELEDVAARPIVTHRSIAAAIAHTNFTSKSPPNASAAVPLLGIQ